MNQTVETRIQEIFVPVLRGAMRVWLRMVVRDGADAAVAQEVILADTYGLAEMKRNGYRPRAVVDVGANIGAFSVLAGYYWPTAVQWAFEPEEGNFKMLQANCPWVKNVNAAVRYDGVTEYIPVLTLHGSGFMADQIGKEKEERERFPVGTPQKVKTVKLEDFITEDRENILLKLDCEGSEFNILENLNGLGKWVSRAVGEYHHRDGYAAIHPLLVKAFPQLKPGPKGESGKTLGLFEAL